MLNTPLTNSDLWGLQWGAVVGASMLACVTDLRERRIPNRLTAPLFAGGLVWAVLAGGAGGVLDALCGCLLLAAPFVVLFALGVGGGGDAKLMGAIGAWLGVGNGLLALLAVVAAGALWSFGIALKHGRFLECLRGVGSMLMSLVMLGGMLGPLKGARASLTSNNTNTERVGALQMPYGLAIASGVACAALGVALWRLS